MPLSSSSSHAWRRARLARLRDGRLGRLERRLPRRRTSRGRGPLLARAGGQTVGGALPGGRITRGVGAIVLLALAGLGVRGLIGQKLDLAAQLERAARAQYIPQLEKQLGQRVEVGDFETDLLGRVVIHDVVVGRNPQLPTGALLRAKSLTVGVDIIGLALGRTKALNAVNSIAIEAPQIYVERGKDGQFNLQKLLPPSQNKEPFRWTGRVSVTNGRVFYFDRALPSRSGRPLKVDARGLDATIIAGGNAPYRADVRVASALLPDGSILRDLSAQGAFQLQPRRAWVSTRFPAVPVALLADYAFPRGEVVATRGTVSGQAQIALDGKTLVPRGQLTLSGVDARTTKVREPLAGRAGAGAPLTVNNLSGPLRFSDRAVQSAGLSMNALGTQWTARGSASLGAQKTLFDADIATRALPVARLLSWAKPDQVPLNWKGGSASLSAHLSGDAKDAKVSGALEARGVAVGSRAGAATSFAASVPAARASFVARNRAGAPLQFAVQLNAPRVAGRGSARGNASINGAAGGLQISARGGAGPNSPLEVSGSATTWRAASPRYGASAGRDLRLVASTPHLSNPDWRGQASVRAAQTGQLNLAAFAPAVPRLVRELGTVTAKVRFAGVGSNFKKARATADFTLSKIALSPAAVPAQFRQSVPADALTLRNLSGRVVLNDGQIQVPGAAARSGFGGLRVAATGGNFSLELPDVRLRAAQINPFLRARQVASQGDWRGRVVVSGAGAQSFDARFELASAAVSLRDSRLQRAGLTLQNPLLRGRARIGPNGAVDAGATLTARQISARAGRLGNLQVPASATMREPRIIGRARANRGVYAGAATLSAREITLSGDAAGASNIPASLRGARAVSARATVNFSASKWAARVDAIRAAVPLPNGGVATVSAPSLLAQNAAVAGGTALSAVDLTRLSARFGGGRFDGTAKLRGGQLSARVLARDVDAGALQRLLAARSLQQARLRGSVDALIALEPGASPLVQAQLSRGSVFVVAKNVSLPIDAARARLMLTGQTARVQSATLWSDGARFEATGQIDLGATAPGVLPAASATLSVDALRLATWSTRLQALDIGGLDARGWQQAAPDGLVSGDFQLNAGAQPSLTGTLELRAGTAFGADIESSRAQISAAQGRDGWRVRLANWKGRIEGAPFEGDLGLDTAGNTWSVRLQTEGVSATRVARLRALFARPGVAHIALPLEGDLSADINLSGVLKPDAAQTQPFFVPRAGYARLVAQSLAWQGRPIGTLRADVEIENNLARIQTLELRPDAGANAGANAGAMPRLAVTGTLPLSNNAPGLDLKLDIGEAPLQFFVDAARDTRDALADSDVNLRVLDQVVQYAEQLPPGTRGRVALAASVAGTLAYPIVNVPSFTLRDGRTPLPYGGFSPPATLDVGFHYQAGVVTVDKGEFRLQKTAAQRQSGEDSDDTLLRVEPGARVDVNGSLDVGADVFNANLSQLATWVPALRGDNNAPLLRGELSEFSLRLSGATRAPDVVGSVQAENLGFNSYTLDRLRVARFEIRDGQLQVAPGNFTVAKGAYQSSAASGTLAWDWTRGGPVFDGPIAVNFPVETRDFAALAGLFVPALTEVGADDFSGGISVGGTLSAPRLSGRVTLRNAKFGLNAPGAALPIGVNKVSGTVRFTPDERIEIDAADPLRGTLTSAANIKAPATTTKSKKAPRALPTPLVLAGDWKLQGGVGLDLNAESLRSIDLAIGRQKYDLAFSLNGGAIGTPLLPGARNTDAALLMKTGADGAQRLRWMIAANGRRKSGQTKGGGALVSVGALRLAPDFARGPEALLRSSAENFDVASAADFADFSVAKRVDLKALPDARPQVSLSNFEWGYVGVGTGELDGRLVLDNRDAIQRPPAEAVRLKSARATRTDAARGLNQTVASGKLRLQSPRFFDARAAQIEAQTVAQALPQTVQLEEATVAGAPLRLGGSLTLSNATLTGAPSGGDGVITRLSLFPNAPRFDVRLILGEKVEFITAAFRTGLEGELVASGVPSDPQLLGTVRTRNGQVRFPNARARVSEGRVTIAITRDAATDLLRTRADIDATASGRAGRYLITLGLNGPLDLSGEGRNLQNLRVDVTSDPPLSQSEAFAQLLGTAPRGDGDFSSNDANQAYAGAVLQVLSAPLFSGVERSVAQALGLDDVSFEYRFDEPLAVQFSKAVSDRVFVTYRRSFGAAQGATGGLSSGRTPYDLSIEYRLKGNLRVGLKTDQSRVTTLTLGQTFRF